MGLFFIGTDVQENIHRCVFLVYKNIGTETEREEIKASRSEERNIQHN